MTAPKLTVEGGSAAGVVVAILLAIGIIALSAWITVVAYRGYRKSGDRSVLFLAVGIALTATVPTTARIALPTAGISSLLTTAAAVGVQFAGLVVILYAIYGRSEAVSSRLVAGAAACSLAVFAAPVVAVRTTDLGQSTAMTAVSSVTAVLGGFVAVQAYRGYRRYDRRPMLLLAVGLALLTVGSFVAITTAEWVFPVSDAVAVGTVWTVELLGLVAILQSLRVD
ncbi:MULTISPECIES: hypothetical protein [unclassified Haloarcula]|uniref:DUF7521 family protein n=1 Tax=unclassified Haloarcula TaxID=2624677 RepID=UPI001CDA1A08|nr:MULTISPECIES: hypothetical protein [unclassified Haloarcula]